MEGLRHLQTLGLAATHFGVSNSTAALEKDGEQSLAIGVMSWQRISLIFYQINMYLPKLNFGFAWVPFVLGLLGSFVPKLAKSYLKCPNPTTIKEKMSTAAYKVLKITGKASRAILQHADIVLNVACLINAIALISLGFPVTGSIALFGLFVISLKRCNLLPASVERYMNPVIIIGSFATSITTPMNIILKVIVVALNTFVFIEFVLNSKWIRSCLPEHFKNPFYNKHVVNELPGEQQKVLENVKNGLARNILSVNPTYVYSNEVGRLFSTESEKSIAEINASDLFDALTAEMESSNIALTNSQKKGLENLKICATSGRVSDRTPPEIELFQKVIKLLVQSILTDKDNFNIRVKEFAEVGNSCVTGWTRDITALLSPQTNEAAWAVHHVLAKMRGEIIKERVLEHYKEYPLLEANGGSNNVHIINAIQGAFWHRLRTYEGELDKQLDKPSVITSLFFRNFFMNDNTKSPSFIEMFYLDTVVSMSQPGLLSPVEIIEPDITASVMDPYVIINSIYDAIKPQYQNAADGNPNVVDQKRVIAWQAILDWMGTIKEKREIDITDDDGEFDPDLVETDDLGQSYLSKAGVKLLLWDLGILTPS